MKALVHVLAAIAFSSAAQAQAPLYDIPGTAGASLGWSLGAIGDVDGDGRADLLMGAPTSDGLQTGAGAVWIASSVTTFPIRILQGEHTGDRFGASVAGIGDVTGDGISEVVVGAPDYEPTGGNRRGAVYVFNGATGAQLTKHVGLFDNDRLGWAVAACGDANADGKPDYAYSAPYGDSIVVGADVGFVWISSGATFTTLQAYWGEDAGDKFGYSICAIPDMTGDGKPDLIAGAPDYDGFPNTNSGITYLLSGGTNTRIGLKRGLQTNGEFGYCVSSLPDLDLDGTTDIAIGEPGWSGLGANTGRVQVLSGANPAILASYPGLVAGDRWGYSVAGLHDMDNDGRGDLIIGAPGRDSAPLFDVGSVYMISGQSSTVLATASGYAGNDNMGFTVANCGDLNNDGFDDMLMAAPVSSVAFSGGGWVRCHLGGDPAPIGYCTAKVNSQGCTPYISYGGGASQSLGSGIVLVAQNVRPGLPGLFLWSVNEAAVPFGGGTLCLGSPIKRTPGQVSSVIAINPCVGQYYFLMTPAYMIANGLNAGQQVHAQCWSRDNGFAPPNNIGLTGGLTFTVVP